MAKGEWVDGTGMPRDASLGEARSFVRYFSDEGAVCPCCAAKCRRYRRPLHAAMAWGLLLIHVKFRDDPPSEGWLHVESYLKGVDSAPASLRGDFPKLRYWGLLESRIGRRFDGNPCTGQYRITRKGQAFARRRTTVPSHVVLYRNKFERLDGDQIDVVDALNDSFDYRKLLEGGR